MSQSVAHAYDDVDRRGDVRTERQQFALTVRMGSEARRDSSSFNRGS